MRVHMTFVVLNDSFNRKDWSVFSKTLGELDSQLRTENQMPDRILIEDPRVMRAAIEAASKKMRELSTLGDIPKPKATRAKPKAKPKLRKKD